MRKKIFCLIMVFVLLFALSACKSDVTSDATTSAVSSETASDTEHTVSGSTESGSDPVTSEDDASGADTGSKTASTASAGTTSKGTTSKASPTTKTSSTASKNTTSKTSSTASTAPVSTPNEPDKKYTTNQYGINFWYVYGGGYDTYSIVSLPAGAIGVYNVKHKNGAVDAKGPFKNSNYNDIKPYYHKSNLTTMIDFADEPLLYYKLDGTTSTKFCYFANYYLAPGEGVYTGDDPNVVYSDTCEFCGRKKGDGYLGTCNHNYFKFSYDCSCGVTVNPGDCHTH